MLLALGSVAAPSAAEVPEVVVSIKPVHSLVAAVMEGIGEPQLIVQGVGSEHTYSMRPSEARAVSEADLVFWIGPAMETWLTKPLAALADQAEVVALAEVEGLTLLPAREGGMWERHEHAGEAGHHQAEGEHADVAHRDEGEEHEHGAMDMHVWLDPANAAVLVDAIAADLRQADSTNAAQYASNAQALQAELTQLQATLETKLAPLSDQPYVVFHDAYQYFEARFGLHPAGAITIGPERKPGAKRLKEIRHRLEELDAACVFSEPQFEPTVVETVIEGTGAKTGVLDPLGANLAEGPEQYSQLLNRLADSLTACLDEAKSG